MNIRDMKVEDVGLILETGESEEFFQTSPTLKGFWSEEQIVNSINSDDDVLLVAEENDKIIAYTFAILHRPTKVAIFENLWVHSDHRKGGVGAELFEQTIKRLKINGAEDVCGFAKESNVSMLKLLEKSGWDKGYKFYWMEKEL